MQKRFVDFSLVLKYEEALIDENSRAGSRDVLFFLIAVPVRRRNWGMPYPKTPGKQQRWLA